MRLFQIELVPPVVASAVFWAAGRVASAGRVPFFGFAAVAGGARGGGTGLLGGQLVWRAYHLGGWVFVLVGVGSLGGLGVSLVSTKQRRAQRAGMVTFTLMVAELGFVYEVSGVAGWVWWARLPVLAVPPVVAVGWCLLSPIDETARGFRRRVRAHRLQRMWQQRVGRLVAGAGMDVGVRVVAAREDRLGADVMMLVRPMPGGQVQAPQVAGLLVSRAAGVWGRVRWADHTTSPIGPGQVSAGVDRDDARVVWCRVLRGDPIGDVVDAPEQIGRGVMGGVRFGVDDRGREVVLPIFESSALIGGRPGAGKSMSLGLVAAAAVRAPDARLWAVDLKRGVELGLWMGAADRAADDHPATVRLLADLEAEMDSRLDGLKESGARKISPSADMPVLVVVIDELAECDRDELARLMRIMRLGRAAGISVWAATQRPSSQLIPTDLRALFRVAVGFPIGRREDSDIVLGRGMAADGVDASTLREAGQCWVVLDDRRVRCRAFRLDDAAIGRVVGSTAEGKGAGGVVGVVTANQAETFGVLPVAGVGVTAAEVSERVGRDGSQVRRELAALAKAGVVVSSGSRPARWRAVAGAQVLSDPKESVDTVGGGE